MAKKPMKEYLLDGNFYYVPEIYDCISTRAAQMSGFEMVMISSSDFSCSYTGIPDLALLSVDEYVALTERITYMTDMPLFIDADEGFGRPLQTFHGCKRMAKAGADVILVTDSNPMGQPGILSTKDALYRYRAAKDGMAGTNCLLMASTKCSVDEDFDAFAERCNCYLEEGVDIICPLEVNRSVKYGSKMNAARKVGQNIKARFWYPDLDPGDKGDEIEKMIEYGYKFTGIHYAFRAAMYAMLDTGRHVFETKTNDYVMSHYDYTGFHFHYSPMACFLNSGEWANREKRYHENPEDVLAQRKVEGFCGDTDRLEQKGEE